MRNKPNIAKHDEDAPLGAEEAQTTILERNDAGDTRQFVNDGNRRRVEQASRLSP